MGKLTIAHNITILSAKFEPMLKKTTFSNNYSLLNKEKGVVDKELGKTT